MKAVLELGPLDGLVVDLPALRQEITVTLGPVEVVDEAADLPDTADAFEQHTYRIVATRCPADRADLRPGAEPHAHPTYDADGCIRFAWERP